MNKIQHIVLITLTIFLSKFTIAQSKMVSKGFISDKDIYTGIPPKMPNDFNIKYEMSSGISGEYRTILIQFGSCTDEGKKPGEAKYVVNWINKNLKEYENLYNELYKINAFTLKYTSKGDMANRGGESIQFTINKTVYIVSDKDNNYIKAGEKPAFIKAITLILTYVDQAS